MRTPLLTALFGLLISTGAVASVHGEAVPGNATADALPGQASVQRNSIEVSRLEHDVAAQEQRSREASERLREQDRKLEELHRQLESIRAGASAQNHGR
ncbi:MAG TPA: hypothetical protein VFW82_15235 [Dyella sp.]|nr:hypothetical protein [Dyella sp.]